MNWKLLTVPIILSICALLLNVGCMSQGFSKIRRGMDDRKVLYLMGSPSSREDIAEGEMLSWWDDHYNAAVDELGNVIYKYIGAAEKYPMVVDAYSRDTPQKRIAIVLPSMPNVSANDLEFLQVKKLVEILLQKKGYKISTDANAIDTVVFVNFGVSKPQKETQIWSEPVYTYDFSNLSSTHNIYNARGANVGRVQSQGTSGGPRYGGERIQSQTITTYIHHLVIEATDYAYFLAHKDVKPFWKVKVLEQGPSGDQRQVLPYMVFAAKGHLEGNTGNQVNFSVFSNDPRAAVFRRAGRSIANEPTEFDSEL